MRKLLIVILVLLVSVVVLLALGYRYMTHRVEGDYFDSDGARLHYTVEGQGDPVILLHGFAVHADLNWRRPGLTEELAKHYRVIALDLRGHGLSDKPHDTAAYGDHMIEDIRLLMDHLQIDKAHLIGYSLGGFITLKFAVDHPERLLTASVLGAGWERPDESAFMQTLAKMAEALETGGTIPPLAGSLGGPDRAEPTFLHQIWVRILTGFFCDGDALAALIRSIPSVGVEEEQVRSLSMPVCNIVGGNDPLAHGAQALTGRVPDLTQVIIPEADHIRTPMQPLFRETLFAFLAAHSTAGQ